MPPLLIDKKFVTDIKGKRQIFFEEQCICLKNGSTLSSSQGFLTRERLSSLPFSNDEILKLIRSLKVLKADGHGYISIRIIKKCCKFLVNL